MIYKIKWKYLNKLSIPIYLISLLLLVIVLFHPYTNGSRGWLKIAGFSMQPSELTKFSLILLCHYLIKNNIKSKLLYLAIFLIPSILTYLEPDTGAIIIYMIIFLYFLPYFFKKKDIIIAFFFLCTLVAGIVFLYIYRKDIFIDIFSTSIYYRLDRLISFKNQDNLQVMNALISIGSGKLLYFPEANNDFFFAYLVSLNYLNFFLILLCYFFILIYLLMFKNKRSKLFFFILLFQVAENIGMNLGLLPVIGIPLPFLSYGGSHTLSTFLILGLCLKND